MYHGRKPWRTALPGERGDEGVRCPLSRWSLRAMETLLSIIIVLVLAWLVGNLMARRSRARRVNNRIPEFWRSITYVLSAVVALGLGVGTVFMALAS